MAASEDVEFFVAVVACAHLHKPRHGRQFQRVVHDRRVRPREALVRLPQVHVGVDLQDAEALVPFVEQPHQPEGGAVIAAEERHHLTLFQPVLRR